MQTVSCVFIQTMFVLFSKQSRDEGGGGRVSSDGQRERKVKDNSATRCDQCECLRIKAAIGKIWRKCEKESQDKNENGFYGVVV